MKKKGIFIILTATILVVLLLLFFSSSGFFNKKSFTASTLLLKMNLPVGGESYGNVKITNNKNTEEIFSLNFINLKDIASVNEESFLLEAGENKEVKILFKDAKNEIGVYAGQLVIKNSYEKDSIPIILIINKENSDFAINLQSIPNYEYPFPGGKLGVSIKLFNLNCFYCIFIIFVYLISD